MDDAMDAVFKKKRLTWWYKAKLHVLYLRSKGGGGVLL